MRFIGDADARISEDYLRILRFFRFSARFAASGLDREGLLAAIRARDGLARLSRERVRAEFMKLLAAPRASEVVQTMGESGFLSSRSSAASAIRNVGGLIAIEAERGLGGDALLRLAALGVAIPEDAERLHDRLRLANSEYERLKSAAATLVGLHGIAAPPSFHGLQALLFGAGREAARDALALAQAESEAPPADAAFAAANWFLADAPRPNLPISGTDLIARGGRRRGGRSDGRCAPSSRFGFFGPAFRRNRRR